MNTLVIFALAIAVVGATPLFTGEVVKQELRLQKKENLVQEAKKLGLTTLVDLAAKAGLADTLAHGGESNDKRGIQVIWVFERVIK